MFIWIYFFGLVVGVVCVLYKNKKTISVVSDKKDIKTEEDAINSMCEKLDNSNCFVGGSYALHKFYEDKKGPVKWKPNDIDIFTLSTYLSDFEKFVNEFCNDNDAKKISKIRMPGSLEETKKCGDIKHGNDYHDIDEYHKLYRGVLCMVDVKVPGIQLVVQLIGLIHHKDKPITEVLEKWSDPLGTVCYNRVKFDNNEIYDTFIVSDEHKAYVLKDKPVPKKLMDGSRLKKYCKRGYRFI